jgi:Protein of unknown function (DUF3431)
VVQANGMWSRQTELGQCYSGATPMHHVAGRAGPLPEYIYAPCCAEFLVSADRIRKRPLAFYQRALDLANNMDAGSDHVDVALAFE